MIKILVLEDNRDSLEAITEILLKYSSQIQVFGAESKEEAERILKMEPDFSLFFLDINLNAKKVEDTAGIEFAKEIRRRREYEFTTIVFITSILSMELLAYREIHCYRYITKPFDEKEIRDIVRKVLNHAEEKEKEFILVKKDGINYKIYCEDIVYIQAVPRGIEIYMKEEQMEVKYLTLTKLLPKLSEQDFFQCHRMCIINRRYIEYVDLVNQMIKMNGKHVPIEIGVTYKGRIREWLNE